MKPKLVILLSGHVSAGKTTLARELATRLSSSSVIFSSRSVLERKLETEGHDRRSLQLLGQSLDEETGGRWLSDALAADASLADVAIVDAVRVSGQVLAFESRLPSLLHVHLKAPKRVLAERYARRRASHPETELPSYEDVLRDPTEAAIGDLAEDAVLVLDTGELSADACSLIVVAALQARGALP